MTDLDVSVIICTWNRAPQLDITLRSIRELAVPTDVSWELLVVNNNCSDNTQQVLDRHASALPLRALFEPTPGKSNALNHAVREARGRYLVFTDDDVIIDPQWLASYATSFREHAEAGFFGGPAVPEFEGSPPDWLKRWWAEVPQPFAARDLGAQPFVFTPKVVPYGLNMAVRADIHRKYHYDPAMGPNPQDAVRGEETALIREMMADDIEGWYVPGARVRHLIPPARQTVAYLREYYEGVGELRGRAYAASVGRWPVLMRTARLMMLAPLVEVCIRAARVTGRYPLWLAMIQRNSRRWGVLRGMRHARRPSP
jgi:glycosyltransferase involved in cell wall biosynthesis